MCIEDHETLHATSPLDSRNRHSGPLVIFRGDEFGLLRERRRDCPHGGRLWQGPLPARHGGRYSSHMLPESPHQSLSSASCCPFSKDHCPCRFHPPGLADCPCGWASCGTLPSASLHCRAPTSVPAFVHATLYATDLIPLSLRLFARTVASLTRCACQLPCHA